MYSPEQYSEQNANLQRAQVLVRRFLKELAQIQNRLFLEGECEADDQFPFQSPGYGLPGEAQMLCRPQAAILDFRYSVRNAMIHGHQPPQAL